MQSPEPDLDFFERIYRGEHGGSFRTLREDFCGTAALACEWVRRGPTHEAWGCDLDRPTLNWARRHYLSRLGAAARRVHLLRRDVRAAGAPRADVVAALNFSYSVFKTREVLRDYFRAVRGGLRPGGVFFLDVYGGTEAIVEATDRRRIAASRAPDGSRIPPFTYIWEQAFFNPIDHHTICHIHFELAGGKKLRRAFSYDWRLWTLPELQELLGEAGFSRSAVYVDRWDEKANDGDGIYRRRTRFENQDGWVAYVVGYR
ncbi:MAG TPA: class I SAM-dependent methyltransferase [Candidatus Polarisedimenticolaceae bacterium]|nr:class I SAM-dependent methyltransferase [Candidatus Polarisedimenticolaceae bacterium]